MPEGDVVHHTARVLGGELTGQRIDRIALHDRGDIAELRGALVASVAAVGKHLLVQLEGDWTLRVHLGMHGRWQRRHVRQAHLPRWTVVIDVGEVRYVCERSYRAELLRSSALRAHPKLARLGPDLLEEPPRLAEMVARARLAAYAEREIGDLLMDQRVAAGIGNIYKSETLFECRVHPRAKVRQLSDAQLTQLFETAARLLRLGLLIRRPGRAPAKRRTAAKPGERTRRFLVYLRQGKPCPACGAPIERFLQGDMGRSTYFCPRCQQNL